MGKGPPEPTGVPKTDSSRQSEYVTAASFDPDGDSSDRFSSEFGTEEMPLRGGQQRYKKRKPLCGRMCFV